VLGTTAAASILHRMSDQGFRRWSRFLILGISAFYVLHGVWLLLA
jgi:hypothetical protein